MVQTKQTTLTIDGLEVLLTRKRVKNINLRVRRDGTVCVSAPPRVATSTIEEFVASRSAWIADAQSRIARRELRAERHVREGSTVMVWGLPCACHVVPVPAQGKRPGCSFSCDDATLTCHADERVAADDDESVAARDKALESWLRQQLSERVEALLPSLEARVGVACTGIRYRSMSSRWGSCNVRTATVTLNTQLAHHDPSCLEYVVTHELCHLLEPSHNARFHSLMDRFCPSWRERKRLLEER